MNEIQLSTIIQNYTTSIAIIVGGLWAIWKWTFSEWIRQLKEIPSADGELTVEQELLNKNVGVYTLNAIWRVKSELPVHVDPKKTRVDVYIISRNISTGVLEPKSDLGNPVYTAFPFKNMISYVLEPKTESLIKSHFVLNTNQIYIFRWKLFRNNKKHGKKIFAWTKEVIFKT